jgi:hypothetical protein
MFGLRRSILSRGEEWGGEDGGDGEVGGEGQEQGLKVEELAGLMERIRGIRGKVFHLSLLFVCVATGDEGIEGRFADD